jgi:hypothetical protein
MARKRSRRRRAVPAAPNAAAPGGEAAAPGASTDAPPDFGAKGRVETIANAGAAIITISSGEHIACAIDVSGGIPEFVFSCRHRDIRAAPDFEGHPKARYEFVYFKLASDADAADDTYVLTMLSASGCPCRSRWRAAPSWWTRPRCAARSASRWISRRS